VSDEPRPELRALAEQLFAAGRAERPGPALGRRLLLIEPAPTSRDSRAPSSGVEPRESASASRGRRARALGASVAAAVAFAAGSVGLWWSLGQGPHIDMSPDPVSTRARPAPTTSSPPAPPSPPTQPEQRVLSRDVVKAPVAPDAVRAPAPTTPARAPQRMAAATRLPPQRAANEPTSAEPSAASAAREAPEPPARAAEPAHATTVPTPDPQRATLPAAPALGLSEELALLKEARIALRAGEARRALDVLDRHARARAADGLHAEATLLRIEALAALGRRAEASQLAARFVHENPFNALADRAKSFIVASGAAP
jgi:hypothetical protein